MESLLTSLTKSSIKDIERNDFRAETYLKHSNHYKTSTNHSIDEFDDDEEDEDDLDDDNTSLEEEDDDSSDYSQRNSSMNEDTITNMDEALANLKIDDYDSIKYTGHSAGLQLLDEKLFKSKSYVQWPGREDVALQLMSQNELLVVRTSSNHKNSRLDVGFSLSSTIFDEQQTPCHLPTIKSAHTKDVLPSNALIEKAIKL